MNTKKSIWCLYFVINITLTNIVSLSQSTGFLQGKLTNWEIHHDSNAFVLIDNPNFDTISFIQNDGNFYNEVPLGIYSIYLMSDEFPQLVRENVRIITDDTTFISFNIFNSCSIAGYIKYNETKLGVNNTILKLQPTSIKELSGTEIKYKNKYSRTNDDGFYNFNNLINGTYLLTYWTEDNKKAESIIELNEKQKVLPDIYISDHKKLISNNIIEGKVNISNAIIDSGVFIQLIAISDSNFYLKRINKEHSFNFQDVAPGSYNLSLFTTTINDEYFFDTVNIKISVGDTINNLVLNSKKNRIFSGVVYNIVNNPVTDCSVVLYNQDSTINDIQYTNGVGKFKFIGIEPGYYIIEINSPDYKKLSESIYIDTYLTNEKDYRLQKQKFTNLSIYLINQSGQIPESDFFITISNIDDNGHSTDFFDIPEIVDGHYEILTIPLGRYLISAFSETDFYEKEILLNQTDNYSIELKIGQ